MYDKCMTIKNKNTAAIACNGVLVRSEADSNRCTRFCRPLATRPSDHFSFPIRPAQTAVRAASADFIQPPAPPSQVFSGLRSGVSECKYTNISKICKTSAQLCVISQKYLLLRHVKRLLRL